ncbi:MAG: ABC transporter ATP-binding protein [Eubacterium sp.]|nr:ABC transporter ATP-binding protein [Eubacterium sp.]
MSEPILKLENIEVKYGDFIAVERVSLEVKDGSMTGLIGTNGSGKTSLMNAVAGLTKPTSGKIYLSGQDVTGMSPEKLVERGLSLVPQGGHCFNRMTVQDNLLVGSYGRKARFERKDNLKMVYDLFPMLWDKKDLLAGSLSGGQRQMVAIGRALMSEPKLLLFDELSLGLAPLIVKDIYQTISRINKEQGCSILLIEQDTKRVLNMTDYAYIMLKGNLALDGPSDKMDQESVKKAYFGI